MNPITNAKNVAKMNEKELRLGVAGSTTSWHAQYKHSAWIFIGGLPYDLTEGDIICVFSQYGEIVNINLVRDKDTGKSKGFCFLCYEDQRSTILAVDNLNTIKILGRILRVDHCEAYRPPKDHGDEDDVTRSLREGGCAPQAPPSSPEEQEEELLPVKKAKKEKKKKKKKDKKKKAKKEKKKRQFQSDESEESSSEIETVVAKKSKRKSNTDSTMVKRERHDSGYEKYAKKNSSQYFQRSPQGHGSSRESSSDSESEGDCRGERRLAPKDRLSRESGRENPETKQQNQVSNRYRDFSDEKNKGHVDRIRNRNIASDRHQSRSRSRDKESQYRKKNQLRSRSRDRDRVRYRSPSRERKRPRDRDELGISRGRGGSSMGRKDYIGEREESIGDRRDDRNRRGHSRESSRNRRGGSRERGESSRNRRGDSRERGESSRSRRDINRYRSESSNDRSHERIRKQRRSSSRDSYG